MAGKAAYQKTPQEQTHVCLHDMTQKKKDPFSEFAAQCAREHEAMILTDQRTGRQYTLDAAHAEAFELLCQGGSHVIIKMDETSVGIGHYGERDVMLRAARSMALQKFFVAFCEKFLERFGDDDEDDDDG